MLNISVVCAVYLERKKIEYRQTLTRNITRDMLSESCYFFPSSQKMLSDSLLVFL